MARPSPKRCALYTRKSSEDGLDQDFNSLDAQREACEAYVASQSGEGWKALADRFDDGGISGATMDRPGLKQLLEEIRAGRVDIVVVYKIDRLTRSLADFARMVEIFEAHKVSFVSVTQAFNTTTSMGRLTLNVLLSFAQFEREVTGERIRDKIAASKRKGLWMGGTLPLGYDLPRDGRRVLEVNTREADTVRFIFKRYLVLGSVHALERELIEHGVRSKRLVSAKGRVRGGVFFSRGALFHLLRNRTYLGEIRHKDISHPGQHAAIIDLELFERVQAQLETNRRRSGPAPSIRSKFSLTGRLFDFAGEPMSPSTGCGSKGTRYRYYVSATLQQGGRTNPDPQRIQRISAPVIEQAVEAAAARLIGPCSNDPLEGVRRVELSYDALTITAPMKLIRTDRLNAGERLADHDDKATLTLPMRLKPRTGAVAIKRGRPCGSARDETLISALRRAHRLISRDHLGLPVILPGTRTPYQRKLIRLAFLSPDLQRRILSGQQPAGLTLARLVEADIPLSWADQDALFGVEPGCYDA